MGDKYYWDVDPETMQSFAPEDLMSMVQTVSSPGYDPAAMSQPGYNPGGYSDLISRQTEDMNRKRAAMEAAQSALTTPRDRAMSRDEGLASALLSILPIGIGALVNGKDGAFVGAQAAAGGLNSFNQGMDKRHEEQKAIDLLNFQNANKQYETAVDLLGRSELGGAQADATLENTRERLNSDPLDNALPEDLQRKTGAKTYRELAATQKNRSADQRDEQIDLQREAEARRKQQFVAKQVSQQLPYIGFVGRTGTEEDFKFIKQVERDTNLLNSLQMDLAESLKTTGRKLGTPESAKQDQLVSRMIDQYKKMQGYGANFTIYEMNLAETGIGSPQGFWSFMAKNDLLGRDLAGAVQNSRDLNERQKLVAFASIGAFHKKQPYSGLSNEDRKAIDQGGIEFDDTGRVTNQDYNEQFIRTAESMLGIESPRGVQVTGQDIQPTAKPSQFSIGQKVRGPNGETRKVTGFRPDGKAITEVVQ